MLTLKAPIILSLDILESRNAFRLQTVTAGNGNTRSRVGVNIIKHRFNIF